MTAGAIVVVDWRDALPESGEPNKQRPAIVVGSDHMYGDALAYLLVVPLTGDSRLCMAGASLEIAPAAENLCTKICYALSWNVQVVPQRRIRETQARVTHRQLDEIRDQIARLVER